VELGRKEILMTQKELVLYLTQALNTDDPDQSRILVGLVRDILDGKTVSVSLSLKSAPAVVGLQSVHSENQWLLQKIEELAKQVSIEKSNYDRIFNFFNDKYPDWMQEFLKQE